MDHFATGVVTGTGAALNVQLGWMPDAVDVIDITNGNVIDHWTKDMPAGTGVTVGASVAPRASNGISQYDGIEDEASEGFTIGSAVSVAAAELVYKAYRQQR